MNLAALKEFKLRTPDPGPAAARPQFRVVALPHDLNDAAFWSLPRR
jgi:hypothetical protein